MSSKGHTGSGGRRYWPGRDPIVGHGISDGVGHTDVS